MNDDPIVIVGSARTSMGAFMGELKSLSAPELGAVAIRAAVERAGVRPEDVQEVIMGNVLSAGQGQAPARQAALGAGLPAAVGCMTINKVCGSGMKAAMLAHDMLSLGVNNVMVAGGMESMSNAPYLLPKARAGLRLGHGEVKDHMFLDGLEDAYDRGRLMGTFAEDCAEKYRFSREAQDRYAITSLKRAQQAIQDGSFEKEIVPVTLSGRTGALVKTDEQPLKANLDKIPQLKPAFRKDGTVTAANSSSISDGAAAMVLMRLSEAKAARRCAFGEDRRVTARTRRNRGGSPRPRWARSASCSRTPDGMRRRRICSRSTRRSQWWRWPRCTISNCRTTRSTCTAAPARWDTRSAPPARASW